MVDIPTMNSNEGYCMKCRQAVVIQAPVYIIAKNNVNITKGTCPVCKTRVSRFNGRHPPQPAA